MGDAIMVLWNASLAQPNHAELACRFALAMREHSRELADCRSKGFQVFPLVLESRPVKSWLAILVQMSDLVTSCLGDTPLPHD